ncbi:hypothetical protein ACIPXV_03050 [Streptomyces libani]|uniref:hypothetical protein n=1 Tax=Streptomyces nigrescens TaxID=1920 RepID=UPI0037F8413F
MKCAEPYPEGTYQECQRDLGHSGRHDYLGTKWSRPEPAEPDHDVAELLERSQPPRTWGVDERSYPVVVVETVTRIVWVDAESEDEALAYWDDDYADLDLKSSDVVDGYLEFQRPDEFQRQDALQHRHHGQKIGPELQCPDCRTLSFTRDAYHDPYRRCHGPITWRQWPTGRGASREFAATPMPARKAVTA